MRAQRVRTGFHRIGIVLLVPFALSAAIGCAVALHGIATMPPAGIRVHGPDGKTILFPEGMSNAEIGSALTKAYGRPIVVGYGLDEVAPYDNQMWQWNDVTKASLWSAASALLGILAYVVCWAVGWVGAGFAGDDSKSSSY
jgi:hypothetical protein